MSFKKPPRKSSFIIRTCSYFSDFFAAEVPTEAALHLFDVHATAAARVRHLLGEVEALVLERGDFVHDLLRAGAGLLPREGFVEAPGRSGW